MGDLLPHEVFAQDCKKALDAVRSAPPDERDAPAFFLAHAAQELLKRRFYAEAEAAEAFAACAARTVTLLPQQGPSAAVSRLRGAEGVRALLFCLERQGGSASVAENAVAVLQRLVGGVIPGSDSHGVNDAVQALGGVRTVCAALNAHSSPALQLARGPTCPVAPFRADDTTAGLPLLPCVF